MGQAVVGNLQQWSAAKGSYVLIIKLAEGQTIKVGSLKTIFFPSGCYAYVGSARGGFKSRLSRHLKGNKKARWHIDYLSGKTSVGSVILAETEDRVECRIAQAASRRFDCIPGFGSSDCRCQSHLFFTADEGQMKLVIMAIFASLGLQPRLLAVAKV